MREAGRPARGSRSRPVGEPHRAGWERHMSGPTLVAPMVDRLTPDEVARRLREDPDSLVLLDVREPEERSLVAIEPSIHLPMGEVMERLDELPRDRPIVVYCHVGERSEMIAAYLETEGFEKVANLSGGIDAWALTVDPSLPRYS